MYQKKPKAKVIATRSNYDWVAKFTGRRRDEIEAMLVAAEEAGVVCIVEVKSYGSTN